MVAMRLLNLVLVVALCAPLGLVHGESLNLPSLIKNGSVRVESASGEPLLAYRTQELLVPASILKVATAFCALEELGADFRYTTQFFVDAKKTLYVKGSGDPTTVSEELAHVARAVAQSEKTISAIVIDTSFFVKDLEIDGASPSRNPYDAKNAAFVGNFSSAALTRRRDGAVVSAEAQTPLTPMSRRIGAQLRRGTTERVKIGDSWKDGALYGGELLSEFLSQAGVTGTRAVRLGSIPPDARLLVSHTSSLDLALMVKGMLEHSTNFTANQIFLTLGAHRFGAPADLAKAQRAMTDCLSKRVGWRHFHIEEGSGLSRRNKVSTDLMTSLLKTFEPYRDLLPVKEGFLAKTGSLNGVNSLAGYYNLRGQGEVRFALIINSNVEHLYKFQAARTVMDYLEKRAK